MEHKFQKMLEGYYNNLDGNEIDPTIKELIKNKNEWEENIKELSKYKEETKPNQLKQWKFISKIYSINSKQMILYVQRKRNII